LNFERRRRGSGPIRPILNTCGARTSFAEIMMSRTGNSVLNGIRFGILPTTSLRQSGKVREKLKFRSHLGRDPPTNDRILMRANMNNDAENKGVVKQF
jgi:hypothetical protein